MARWLFATDGSERATEATAFLNALPLPAGAEIRVVSVLPDPVVLLPPAGDGLAGGWTAMEQIRGAEREFLEDALRSAAQNLARDGVTVTTELRHGDAAHQILAAADEFAAELIVVGSKGLTGLDSFLLGSVARNVAKHAKRPVLVAHAPRHGVGHVLVAVDGSDHAHHAIGYLSGFPLPTNAELQVVHVLRPYSPFPGLFPTDREEQHAAVLEVRERQHEEAASLTQRAVDQLHAAGLQAEATLREGDPANEVLAAAADGETDLIVAGARGVSTIEGLLVGSVADRLLKSCPCSVLIVP